MIYILQKILLDCYNNNTKKLIKNQRKNIFTKDYVALYAIEPQISEEKRTSNITDTNYDLEHIYGSW